MGALASGRPHRRPACGAKHHGGGGLGQPPADAIEASALRARPRWRGRSAPGACGEALSLESEVGGVGSHARNLRDCRPDQVASSGQIFGILSKAENLQRAFAGGGKGLARAAARPALAINTAPRLQPATTLQRFVEAAEPPCSPPSSSSPPALATRPVAPRRDHDLLGWLVLVRVRTPAVVPERGEAWRGEGRQSSEMTLTLT